MKITEAKQEKKELELKISIELSNFYEKTGLKVSSIDTHIIESEQLGGAKFVNFFGVETVVEL